MCPKAASPREFCSRLSQAEIRHLRVTPLTSTLLIGALCNVAPQEATSAVVGGQLEGAEAAWIKYRFCPSPAVRPGKG